PPPPSAGRHAHDTPKAAIKGRKVVEARLIGDRRDRIGRSPQSHRCTPQTLSEDELIGRYAANHVESSEKMVRAHRGISSKLREGQWLSRLFLDPAKALIHPTFPPRVADCLACTALCRSGSGGGPQRSLLKSKIVVGRLGGRDYRKQHL